MRGAPSASAIFGRADLWSALFALLMTLCVVAGPAEARMRQEKLTIITATGERTVSIEVARSDAEKSRGLMFRRSGTPFGWQLMQSTV